jgi:hypothetical protein
MTTFLRSDLATRISGLFGAWRALFGDGDIGTTITVLLVLNLLAGKHTGTHCATFAVARREAA